MTTPFEPLRLGILGTGTAAGLTLSQIAGSPLISVEAIAGRSEASAAAAAAKFGIPCAYSSLEALLADDSIEAVHVALPIGAHAQWVVAALRAGKHVLVEKPAVANAAELDEIERAQQDSGKIVMEAMMVRHHPQWQAVTDLIASGAIGIVCGVKGALTRVPPAADDPSQPFNRTDLGWSVILDNGCYMTHLTRLVFGDEPLRVTALGERHEKTGVFVSVTAMMQFPAGMADFTISTRMRRLQRFQILGTEGRIEVTLPVMPVGGPAVVVVDSRDVIPPEKPRELIFDGIPQFRLQMESFARAVRGLEPPLLPLAEARANMQTLDAIALSADRDGAWVDIGDVALVQ